MKTVALLCAALPLALGAASESTMKELEDQNRKQGFATGPTGEYYRYVAMPARQLTEVDRDEARAGAAQVRCDVCALIVESLVQKAASWSEDGLADQFEGHTEYDKTGDESLDLMLAHKKGCNKHFKDELVAEGWFLTSCKEVRPERGEGMCLWQTPNKPDEVSLNSYQTWKEALFFACEQTVGAHSDALAEYLAGALTKSANRTATVRTACERHAKCSKRKSRGSRGARGSKAGEL